MEYWELFLRGIGRSVEDLIRQMIQKGAESQEVEVAQPIQKSQKKRMIQRRDLGDMEDKILAVIEQHPEGCTLKDIAKALDMQWHYLRIPLRQLGMDGKVEKDGKNYRTPSNTEPESNVVERNGVKRRIVDARTLESTPKDNAEIQDVSMSPREREILRFKILTAFRGRPEGLTLEELAAVLGRSVEGLSYIIRELKSENRIIEGKNGKFHLA
ncbi:hypothetical protein JXA40_00680 [bacterium]|nr:hypothetical protein [candidate division CSSED10-310 bacterium]